LSRVVAQTSLFSRLYSRYFSRLVAGLRARYGNGPPDPADVAQQAFVQLSVRHNLDELADPEAYVWITARNIMISEKRAMHVRSQHARQVAHGLLGARCDDFDPERVLIAKEELGLVMKTLRKMPKRRRMIFLLVRVEGMTPEQAGHRVGVSRSSAVRHVALATAALAEALSNTQGNAVSSTLIHNGN
jgi:RNA polymerase sigma factor (sigma-70 family)